MIVSDKVCIFPVVVINVSQVEVVFLLTRDEWRYIFLFLHSLPVDVLEPAVGLHLMVTVKPYSVRWFSLQTLLSLRMSITLLMKSADSSDHPSGSSNRFIETYFAKIYSLISRRLLPM